MKKKIALAGAIAVGLVISGIAYAELVNPRTVHSFFPGHTHDDDGLTTSAPQHSGGTDRFGCHNASVPYHCH